MLSVECKKTHDRFDFNLQPRNHQFSLMEPAYYWALKM